MKFIEFQAEVSSDKPLRRAYAFAGEEEFLRSEGVEAVVDRAFGGGEPDIGLVTFWGPATKNEISELPPHRIRDELETPAFLSPAKVVLLRRGDIFCDAHGDLLAGILAGLPSNTTLIIESERLDRRKKLAKAILEKGAVVECEKLWETRFGQTAASSDSPLGIWLAQRGRRRGLNLTPDAVTALIELCGNRLGVLDEAMQRVALAIGGKGRADLAAVEAVVGATQDYALYQLSAAVEAGDMGRAFTVLEAMVEGGVAMPDGDVVRGPGVAPVVLGHLGRELEKMTAARDAVDAGQAPEAAAEGAGVRRNRLSSFLDALRRNDRARLHRKMSRLLAADVEVKTGGDWQAALERTVFAVCKR
jgi:DNA polymerase III delta subunit